MRVNAGGAVGARCVSVSLSFSVFSDSRVTACRSGLSDAGQSPKIQLYKTNIESGFPPSLVLATSRS